MDLKEQFLEYLRYQKRYSPHTLRSYETDLDQFSDYCGRQQCSSDSADHTHIRRWIVEMIESGVTNRSVNRKLSTLKSYYKFLIREGKVARNPMEKVVAPKTKKRLPVFVEEDQIVRLLDSNDFGEDRIGKRNQLIIEMFYRTGIRLSELINLKDADVDVNRHNIKVLGKRNKERIIPFSPDFSEMLNNYRTMQDKEVGPTETFFAGIKGKKMYAKEVYRVVTKYLSLVTTLEKKSPHVIRHTFATHLLNKGADLNAIKELLGHANLSATQVYTHNSFEKLKEIYKKAHPRA